MKYFGTDGIRGKAYEFLNYDLAYSVGRSMSLLEDKLVIVCRDTRESGHMIIKGLKQGIIDSGLKVLDIDIQSTPVLAFMSIKYDCHGIMVTASHNPYLDNGIKVFNRGKKTLPEQEQLIENVIDGLVDVKEVAGGVELDYLNPLNEYISLYNGIIEKYPGRIVLDFANGASIKAAKHVFNMISDNLEYIGDAPNGQNINDGVGSTHIEKLVEHVKSGGFDVGFAFDGDGDRVLTVTSDGQVMDGDLMIYVFAVYLKENNLLDNDLVVLTKMSNLGIIEALAKKGVKVVQTDVGDKWVIQAMEQIGAVLGGENSGHVINKRLFVSGDGVLNAAFLIKILNEKKTDLQNLVKDVVYYPEKLHNIRNIDKTIAVDERIVEMVERISGQLGSKGKILVRASGTEPLIRISVSARTIETVDSVIKQVVDRIIEISEEKD